MLAALLVTCKKITIARLFSSDAFRIISICEVAVLKLAIGETLMSDILTVDLKCMLLHFCRGIREQLG